MSEDRIANQIASVDKEYENWLTFARMDFESAKYLNNAPIYPRPRNIICYHCQQAAEKAVKALIVYFKNPGGIPKSHDISFLLGQVKNRVREKKGIEIGYNLFVTADILSKYGVASRYPNEIQLDEYIVKRTLTDCETILKWVEEVIAAPSVQQ